MSGAVFGPGYELRMVIIEALRADSQLQTLLFRDKPQVNSSDSRVYESDADLPSDLVSVLPRVLVMTTQSPHGFEQEDSDGDMGPVTVRIHHFAEKDQSMLVEQLAVATGRVIRSLHDSHAGPADRIIASELVKTGPRIEDRQPGFGDARRITDTYIAANVGVLA